jgi:hypothetical protein
MEAWQFFSEKVDETNGSPIVKSNIYTWLNLEWWIVQNNTRHGYAMGA